MTFKVATEGKRFLTHLVDTIIFIPIMVVIGYLAIFQGYDDAIVKSTYSVFFIILLVLFWIIFKGQSPGQMILKVKIIDDKTYEDIKVGQSLVRAFGYLLSNVFFGLPFLTMFFREDKKGLHDMIAGTLVIDLKDIPEETLEKEESNKENNIKDFSNISNNSDEK